MTAEEVASFLLERSFSFIGTELPPASSDCDGRRWYLLLGTRTTDGA